MRGAISYAEIMLTLTEDELIEVQRDDAFDDIIAWLALHRESAVVDAAYRRLVGRVN